MSSLSRTVAGALSALVMVVAGLQASPAATAVGESVPDPATDTARFAPDAYVAPDADAATLAAVAADTNRPLMAVPFKCGQVWRGSAWTGHRPALAIDFNLYSGGDTDLGKPVKASAAGTVLATRRYSGTGYGQTVLIGHGNGYRVASTPTSSSARCGLRSVTGSGPTRSSPGWGSPVVRARLISTTSSAATLRSSRSSSASRRG